MNRLRALLAPCCMSLALSSAPAPAVAAPPLVIAHRGASGDVPEHTLAAYWLAIEQGADYVEPDLVSTRDGVLVARHENAIAIVGADGALREATTDVAERPEFADRRTTKVIDGVAITGWFTEDFSLAELKTLRALERLPALRPANTRFDRMFEVPTFAEVLQLVADANARRAREARAAGRPAPPPIGVYPETKHPSHFQRLGLALEEPLVRTLRAFGYRGADAPVFVQSFEVANLRRLRRMTRVPLVQLIDARGAPQDFVLAGDARSYADLLTPAGLAEVSGYAQAIGVHASLVVPTQGRGLGAPTALVADAHRAGLRVHAWTFRAENRFLPREFAAGDADAEPARRGDFDAHLQAFLRAGLDGFFTDHPFLGRRVRDAFAGR